VFTRTEHKITRTEHKKKRCFFKNQKLVLNRRTHPLYLAQKKNKKGVCLPKLVKNDSFGLMKESSSKAIQEQ
jgi:hypothetical protein